MEDGEEIQVHTFTLDEALTETKVDYRCDHEGVCQVFCVNSLQSFHALSTIILGKGKRPASPSH